MSEAIVPIPRPAERPTLKPSANDSKPGEKEDALPGHLGRPLDEAVELCRDHSISKVSRALRLDYYGLRKRAHKTMEARSATDLGFVKLDLGRRWSRPRMEGGDGSPNGAKMTLSLKGAPGDLDPLELSRVFWSQGR